ncbi:MAG: hypothetical protein R3284_12085 [Rubricoccaceae bacterium]|nr:hypothetical protein [Rubricoccaceae bacterium]
MGAPGIDKLLPNILKWTQREEWRDRLAQVFEDHLGSVCDDFDLDMDSLADEIGLDLYDRVFTCIIDDFLTCKFEPDGQNIIEDYVKRRGWRESVPAKRYLQAHKKSVMSLYEVTETRPGKCLFVRDLLRAGDPICVYDRNASESAARWDRLAARVLHVNGKDYFAPGILLFPMDGSELFLEELGRNLKKARKKLGRLVEATKAEQSELGKLVDDAFLSEAAPLFTNFWLHTTLADAQRPLPKLFNSDGEELEFCEVQFPVSAMNSKEIKQRLRSVKGLSPADDRSVNWQWLAEEADTRLTPALPETGLAWGTVDEEGRKILGSIELRDRSLVLSTNSRERAERGGGLLQTALGDLVGTSLTSVQTVERLMEEDRPAARPDPEPELPLGLEDQIFAEYSDRHYQQTLSQKIPALGDRTPRQAARSKTGRVKLVNWLKYLENADTRRARHQEQSPYDFSWMWEELGISDLRK